MVTRPAHYPALPRLCTWMVLAVLISLAGCSAKRVFPEPPPGWHSPSYSVIFGRLQQLPSKTEDAPPVWVVHFGQAGDAYNGELALTPPERLLGYSGGERVELRGKLREDLAHPDYPGKWYEVSSIQLWANRK